MKIYTKTGDGGTTSPFNGKRVKKSHKIIEALGSIDELNAVLGTVDLPEIDDVQKDLMAIASKMAGFKKNKVPDSRVQWLEKEIDRMQEKLPELRNFILPKGQIHFARAICRKTERRIVDSGRGQNDILKYLNRLSDYLFVLARWENFKNKKKEIIWILTN